METAILIKLRNAVATEIGYVRAGRPRGGFCYQKGPDGETFDSDPPPVNPYDRDASAGAGLRFRRPCSEAVPLLLTYDSCPHVRRCRPRFDLASRSLGCWESSYTKEVRMMRTYAPSGAGIPHAEGHVEASAYLAAPPYLTVQQQTLPLNMP